MRIWISCAPACRKAEILRRDVVPRMIESSTTTTRLPLTTSSTTASFMSTLLARWLYARRRDMLRMLVESFLALGVVFATLAIPLALDGRWTAAAWARPTPSITG